jgi:hypothetical protein
MTTVSDHIALDVLLQDWLGECDPATREAVDVHLMACDSCGALFDEVLALGQGMREALRAGLVFTVAHPGFVERLAAQGLRVREYRVPHNGSVNCTVAPEDEVLVSRLQAPLQGVQRLDVLQEVSFAPGVQNRVDDIPFDPVSGEVLYLARIAKVRQLPAHTMRLTLLARDAAGSREVGHYEFHHSPWLD